ncbi:MAG: hypothetical protein HQM04_17405 [Magnetococcales bacterium]|nr:hypothetical protein [Magnetococcales bacterium]MBF0116808.1 hypothetical protein [Magnetococcales bacterium]
MRHATGAKAWVGLKEVLLGGVTPARHAPAPRMTQGFPTTWVSAWDYWVDGVRKPVQRDTSHSVILLKPPRQQQKEIPPEAWWTSEQVIAEIQSIFSETIVPIKVADMLAADQLELDQGEISEEEMVYRTERLEEIQEEHYVRLEGIIHWYVDNYFRDLGGAEMEEQQRH